MIGAFLGMDDGLGGNPLTSGRFAIRTWCPLNFGAATAILVLYIDTHLVGIEGVP